MGKYELPRSISRKTRRIQTFTDSETKIERFICEEIRIQIHRKESHTYEAPGKFEYNRKGKKFPASTNYNKHYEAPTTKYNYVQRYQDNEQKVYYNKNFEKHSNYNDSKHAQTNYSNRRNSKNLQKKLHTHR
ncbi:hypothetical protein TNCV_660271 [Trichonephila clavipes]|nr:hypothetical protein TNCV_660271 [Trichonephila clavipes]